MIISKNHSHNFTWFALLSLNIFWQFSMKYCIQFFPSKMQLDVEVSPPVFLYDAIPRLKWSAYSGHCRAPWNYLLACSWYFPTIALSLFYIVVKFKAHSFNTLKDMSFFSSCFVKSRTDRQNTMPKSPLCMCTRGLKNTATSVSDPEDLYWWPLTWNRKSIVADETEASVAKWQEHKQFWQ